MMIALGSAITIPMNIGATVRIPTGLRVVQTRVSPPEIIFNDPHWTFAQPTVVGLLGVAVGAVLGIGITTLLLR